VIGQNGEIRQTKLGKVIMGRVRRQLQRQAVRDASPAEKKGPSSAPDFAPPDWPPAEETP